MDSLQDKVCVITGGGSGIGEAMCRSFAAEGARVVCVDWNFAAAQAVVADIGSSALALRADCGVEMDLRRVILQAEHEVGPIDIFCANAGIPSNGGLDVPNDEWDRIMRINFYQQVFVARHLFPLWQRRGGGQRLVITASAAGLLTQVGSLPYAVTKHAAVAAAEWLAISYAEHGIGVHCLCPQAVRSGMTAGTDGGVAGGDGMLEPEQVVAGVRAALRSGEFLITPHPEVRKYMARKAQDTERWIKGMRRLHDAFGKDMMRTPPNAAKL
eukprot:g2809.t1